MPPGGGCAPLYRRDGCSTPPWSVPSPRNTFRSSVTPASAPSVSDTLADGSPPGQTCSPTAARPQVPAGRLLKGNRQRLKGIQHDRLIAFFNRNTDKPFLRRGIHVQHIHKDTLRVLLQALDLCCKRGLRYFLSQFFEKLSVGRTAILDIAKHLFFGGHRRKLKTRSFPVRSTPRWDLRHSWAS